MTITACPVSRITWTGELILAGTRNAKLFHLLVFTNMSFGEITLSDKKDPQAKDQESKSCQKDGKDEYFYQHAAKIIKMWLADDLRQVFIS